MNTILWMIAIVAVMLLVERLWPANRLPETRNWWARVVFTNAAQAGIVLVFGATWDRWAAGAQVPWALRERVDPVWQVVIGYVTITFVYYWWHRLRHESRFFWRVCHQLHHSPRRLEVLMSFYKHPVEIAINGLLSSTITFLLLGCSVEAAGLITLATGVAELFYHWNIRTPVWLGTVFQRPESHRVHHQRGRHTLNYSDLPLWDMLFGTYRNPTRPVGCGFDAWREDRFDDMIAFRDVHAADAQERPPLHLLPTCIGCSKRWACQQSRERTAAEIETEST